MFIEKERHAIRSENQNQNIDIDFLVNYYKENKLFPLFSQVLIETRTDCNKRCSFCAQSFFRKPVKSMKWRIYRRIIDSLSDIGFTGRIALFTSNEPLLDERLAKMIKYARIKSPRFFIDITTNGTLLSIEKLDQLLSVGLDNININDYRNDRDKEPNKISNNLIDIVEKFRSNPKLTYNARSTKENLPNYGGTVPQDYNVSEYGFCNFPFRKLVFSYNGDILLCCNDFRAETKLGNIEKDSILSIWNSDDFNLIRHSLLNNKRISLCEKCNEKQIYSTF